MSNVHILAFDLARQNFRVCATSHYWGRVVPSGGHGVRLVAAIYVKPFVKRQKNDAADVAAIAEAVLRPNIHYVAVKSVGHQARAVILRTHQCLVRPRTQLINALRGRLAEFGPIFPQGSAHPKQAATVLKEAARDNAGIRRLCTVPGGVGPVTAGAVMALRLICGPSPAAGTSPPGLVSCRDNDRRAERHDYAE